jgi:hypothetical protein
VDWPEASFVGLRGIGGIDDGGEIHVGFFVGVVGGEGDVVCGVPVFCSDFEGEGEGEEFVDRGYDVASTRHCKGTVLS